VVPVVRTLPADHWTPVSAFHRLAGTEPDVFLFESVERGEAIGRHSLLGRRPFLRVVAHGTRVELAGADAERHRIEEMDAPTALRAIFDVYRRPSDTALPPFTAGAVGYFAYDAVRWMERVPDRSRPAPPEPDLTLFFPEEVVVFDHALQQLHLIVNARPGAGDDVDRTYARAVEQLDALRAELGAPVAADESREEKGRGVGDTETAAPLSNLSRGEFADRVREAKRLITAGDIFQVVLSRRLRVPCDADDLSLYRELRALNPSPYMFLLRLDGWSAVGSSPEPLLRVTGDRLQYRPIAGTAARCGDDAEDDRRAAALVADPKERAEHVMLVDLGRNDLGRVAAPGSVRVDEFMTVERYSHVMHLVSGLSARLRPDLGALDAFFACFPAGTVSGAPKVRAMEIIEDLEPERRGLYGGAVGYLDFSGNLDTCIALRTMVVRDGEVRVQAGAGIVADSDPDREFEETEHKAGALLEAVRRAEAAR
jgi:anthranilate synthase component 1